MDLSKEKCPACGRTGQRRNPLLTVDIIIELGGRASRQIVLVKRKNPPPGWALPGGFVDYGETVEEAARREAHEETGLAIDLVRQFHVYSEPGRDPRGHTVTVTFVARATGEPKGGDDASLAEAFPADRLPTEMAFDHRQVIQDYLAGKY
ncbi:MAG TPA: NUDIX hydrolase [bacterium]|nr:NUDIX hydrolase [bacterium]